MTPCKFLFKATQYATNLDGSKKYYTVWIECHFRSGFYYSRNGGL